MCEEQKMAARFTMNGIRDALKGNVLDLGQLREMKRLVEKHLRDAETEEHRRIASCDPKDLLPETWQLYHRKHDDATGEISIYPGYPEAKAAMDVCGILLCKAIRSEDVDEIKVAMKEMNRVRGIHSSIGAMDTAVRESLGCFFDKCCVGTRFDGYCDELWEDVYGG